LLDLVSLSDCKKKPVAAFSKGMVQRLALAQCLLNNPQVLFLDEPNSGLDPIGRRDMRDILIKLKEQGTTIFLNSHLLPDVNELCDRIAILHEGRLVAEEETQKIAASGDYRALEEYFMDKVGHAQSVGHSL
jgi:ABC-2 type transport system ATP-binding protein